MLKAWLTINKLGFSLVEVLLAGAIFGLLITALVGAFLYGQEATALAGNRARALLLAEEGLEAVRSIRDAGYANLADGNYGLAVTGNQWTFSGIQDVSDIFTRQVNIASADSKRKSVISQVTWQQNPQRTGSVTLVSRLTNWIASAGNNWATPVLAASLDLTGAQNAVKIQVQGNYAYIVRNNASPSFIVVDISVPASPTIVGSLILTGTPTNIFVSGNYAYITNTSNTEELQIINISNPATPSQVSAYNDAGNEDARGVYVVGNYAYLGLNGGNDLAVVNVANPAAPVLAGGLVLNGGAYELMVLGNYAFIGSSDDTQDLQVVNISNPAALVLSGSLNLAGTSDIISITGFNQTIIAGRASGSVNVIDVTAPAIPSLTGLISPVAGAANDLSLGSSNSSVFMVNSDAASEFVAIDISTPATPALIGFYDAADTLEGVVYDSVSDRVFAVGDANAAEFIVLAPQ